MQLHQLKALVCVADVGSISAAARALGLSQPAVTRAVKQLELDVHASLLVRGGSGVALTACGVEMVHHARQILQQVRRAQEQIAQMVGDRSGSLAIASSPVPLSVVVPQAITLLRKQFPDVRIRLEEVLYPKAISLFRDACIDFAIGPIPEEGLGEDYRCDMLFEVELAVVVRRGHKLSKATSLRMLTGLNWIITGPAAGPGAIHERSFAGAGLRAPTCALNCESVSSALQMVANSDVASFVPEPLAQAAQAAGLVTIVKVQEKSPCVALYLFMPAQTILTPAGQALYSAVRSVSRSLVLSPAAHNPASAPASRPGHKSA